MNFWKKIPVVLAIVMAVFLFQGAINTSPAEAAIYKFKFTGEEVNGYFIYNDTTEPNKNAPFKSPFLTAYYGGVTDFKVDVGEKGNFAGQKSNIIVFLPRMKQDDLLTKLKNQHDEKYGDDTYDVTSPADFILLQVYSYERTDSPYTFVSYFKYPEGAFNGSVKTPKKVPDTAEIAIFPNVDFPKTLGEPLLISQVKTEIEKVSD